MTDKQPDCYKCIHRGSVPGSAHSRCSHPATAKVHEDPLLGILGVFASVGRTPPMIVDGDTLNIKGNSHGIAKGWFNWPLNFDPTWLDNCDGFEQSEKEKEEGEEL